jgi:hypothetical protein
MRSGTRYAHRMNFRPYFEASFGGALREVWPAEEIRPIRSLGRYDAVLRWMEREDIQKVKNILGPPAPANRVDAQDLVSFVAFVLEDNPNASTKGIREKLYLPHFVPEGSDEELLAKTEDGYTLVRLVSRHDFDREGQRMEHCLRSFLHYFNEHERGEIAILSVRHHEADEREPTRLATLEVDLRPTPNARRIVQLQGVGNGELRNLPGDRDAVRRLLRAVGLFPHLHGRWMQRVLPPVSGVMAGAIEADRQLDWTFDRARHHGTHLPSALHVWRSSIAYLESLPLYPQGAGLSVRMNPETPHTPVSLTLTLGEESWTGTSWVDVEQARQRTETKTNLDAQVAPLPEITEAGTRFRARLSALPS